MQGSDIEKSASGVPELLIGLNYRLYYQSSQETHDQILGFFDNNLIKLELLKYAKTNKRRMGFLEELFPT